METIESLGYLKGLIEGLKVEDEKQAKIFQAIVDVLDNICEDIDDVAEGMELMAEQIDAIDDDLTEVEDYLADEDDCDCCDCDDCDCDDCDECQEYEVECPICKEFITVDEETIFNGTMPCPNCGEVLEFEVDCDCDDCDED